MAKKPFFSIVIVTYNRAEDLQFTLYCVLSQSFSDFEIIISDNCSTDNTQDLFNSIKDKRIRYFRNKTTVNLASNIQYGIKHAKGQYVFLHGDDDFLLYSDSLKKIHEEIMEYKPGYIRLNYFSLAIDKKHLFSYRVHKPFKKNEYRPPFLENKDVMSFIVDSDNYFITGIIFRNTLPRNIKIIDTDPASWIEILFYTAKNFGAYFIAQPHIVACWSRREMIENAEHHFYTLKNGKLMSENYFEAVKEKLHTQDYNAFLHRELIIMYVHLFPAIKVVAGNKKMHHINARMCELDPTMTKSITYWIYFIPALIAPRSVLAIFKEVYLYWYARFTKIDNNKEVIKRLKALESRYLKSSENVFKRKEALFNF